MAIGNTNNDTKEFITPAKLGMGADDTVTAWVENGKIPELKNVIIFVTSASSNYQSKLKEEIDSALGCNFYGIVRVFNFGSITYLTATDCITNAQFSRRYNSTEQSNFSKGWSPWVPINTCNTLTSLNIPTTATLNNVVDSTLIPAGLSLELWINDSTTIGQTIRSELKSSFGITFFGFCTIRRTFNGSTWYVTCEDYNSNSKYTKLFTSINNANKWTNWTKIC